MISWNEIKYEQKYFLDVCYLKSLIKHNSDIFPYRTQNQKFTSDGSADIWRKFNSAPSHNPSIKKGGACTSFDSSSEKLFLPVVFYLNPISA